MIKKIVTITLTGFMCFFVACKKDVLKGIDKKALFAQPTAEELQAIQLDWHQRALLPADITVEESHKINDNLALKMISFRLYGYKQYAAVLLPDSPNPLPVQVYISGFGLDMPYSFQDIVVPDAGSLPFVYIVPALRGQSLKMTVNGVIYTTPASEGKRNDAFDGAADDALAALNAVGMTFTEADTSKVMARGGSRGATVALLMGIRDQRVKRVVAVAGPTDLLTSTIKKQDDLTYRFQFLDDLINGAATVSQTRTKLIASSPLYFCNRLPKTQLHFGGKDEIVPLWNGQFLFDIMKSLGKQDNIELYTYKNRTHDNIGRDNVEMTQRIDTFFGTLYN